MLRSMPSSGLIRPETQQNQDALSQSRLTFAASPSSKSAGSRYARMHGNQFSTTTCLQSCSCTCRCPRPCQDDEANESPTRDKMMMPPPSRHYVELHLGVRAERHKIRLLPTRKYQSHFVGAPRDDVRPMRCIVEAVGKEAL